MWQPRFLGASPTRRRGLCRAPPVLVDVPPGAARVRQRGPEAWPYSSVPYRCVRYVRGWAFGVKRRFGRPPRCPRPVAVSSRKRAKPRAGFPPPGARGGGGDGDCGGGWSGGGGVPPLYGRGGSVAVGWTGAGCGWAGGWWPRSGCFPWAAKPQRVSSMEDGARDTPPPGATPTRLTAYSLQSVPAPAMSFLGARLPTRGQLQPPPDSTPPRVSRPRPSSGLVPVAHTNPPVPPSSLPVLLLPDLSPRLRHQAQMP